jgi:hypothetical protein
MQELIALHRYYIWANRLRIQFDEALQQESKAGVVPTKDLMRVLVTDSNIFMSYWYSALFVVVEGWGRLQLSDSRIGTLLSSPNVTLLKNYRHGVSHFQPEYFDPKFLDFVTAKGIVPWVRELNLAFGAFFLARLGSGQSERS